MTSDAQRAEKFYIDGLASGSGIMDWHIALQVARKNVVRALRASRYLTDIEGAIELDGEHLRALRHMLAPPVSQDQFALICPAYNKRCEKSGRTVRADAAPAVAAAILSMLDPKLARWLSANRKPSTREVRSLMSAVAPLLGKQSVETVRRGRLSAMQEGNAIKLLEEMGWSRIRAGIVDQSSTLPALHFMHKTRFATKTRPQEVDIACGLGGSVVLAMECKVTNDRTNSVKRVNDVLKKATAWQDHWGSFVRTAALLQGVIAEKDVARLEAANVHVFWSHDLPRFQAWLESEVKA